MPAVPVPGGSALPIGSPEAQERPDDADLKAAGPATDGRRDFPARPAGADRADRHADRRGFLRAAGAAAMALGPWRLAAASLPALSREVSMPPTADARHAFDFFHGRWTVDNRRLRHRFAGSDAWETFPGTLDCRPLLGGLGNLDEFRGADVHGLSLRLYDPASGQWSDRWASAVDGRLGEPALGRFAGGVGTFLGADSHQGQPALNRMVFRDIDRDDFTWEQAGSLDGGANWETHWVMHIRRAG